jgi:hypothetical protein
MTEKESSSVTQTRCSALVRGSVEPTRVDREQPFLRHGRHRPRLGRERDVRKTIVLEIYVLARDCRRER